MPGAFPPTPLTSLLEKKLIFVTGKGGVGKTTTAAALGSLAAEAGRKTLICEIEIDPAMRRIFGAAEIGFEPSRIGQNLYACNLSGDDSLRAFIQRFVPSKRIAGMVLENKVAGVFFRAAPSVMEAVILDRLAWLLERDDPSFDTIVVDLPASGHAVTFLNVPRSMARMIAVGDLAAHLRKIARLISDPGRTEVVVVSLPDEIVINETLELWRKLRETVDTPVRTVVVNGVRAPSLRAEDLERVEQLGRDTDPEAFAPLASALRLGMHWKDEDARNIQRLADQIEGRVVASPFVFDKTDDPDLVRRLADVLRDTSVSRP